MLRVASNGMSPSQSQSQGGEARGEVRVGDGKGAPETTSTSQSHSTAGAAGRLPTHAASPAITVRERTMVCGLEERGGVS